jgi:acetate---CoA ligase (ADP-forming)
VRVTLSDALFRPRGIAVIGASNDPDKLSGRPLDFLLRLGYKGDIYPVNPTRTQVQGARSYSSLKEIPGPVDLAIVVVPAPGVAQALHDCAAAGVSAAIVFASGFAEVKGEKGRQMQDEIVTIAKATGLRVLGPNCLGSFAVQNAAFATFSSAFDELTQVHEDAIAIVSQSGAVGTYLYTTMQASGVGARYYANTGNEADISAAELLGAMAHAPDVDILIGYLEDGRRLDRLAEAAAAADSRGKPLILMKSGATTEGARAVGFHTGSMPGSDADFTALVRRYGAIRVESMEQAGDLALMFRPGRRSAGRRLAIVTSSGGASALATDAAVQCGLAVEAVSADTEIALRALMPHYGSAANPIDLTGSLLNDAPMLESALGKVVADQQVDMVLVVIGNADRGSEALVHGIHQGYLAAGKPFAVAWTGGSGRPRQALLDLKVPTYAEPLRAVRALRQLADFSLRTRPH